MKIYDPKKILVPVDFSEISKGILQAGLEIGKLREAEVTVLHVAKESDYRIHYGSNGGELVESITWARRKEDVRMELESRLQLMLREVSAGPKVESIIIWGDPVKDILHVAQSGDFDLIVMATHGRRGLNRLFMGSVVEEVIRRAPCPVFVIRDKVAAKQFGEAGREPSPMS